MAMLNEVMEQLRAVARPDQLAGMARYGMNTTNRLGVTVSELRRIAKKTGKDHELALALWRTGVADARILASMVDEPQAVTPVQMDDWAAGFDSWDVCDQVCMNLFDKTPLAWHKVREWAGRDEEFVKRAAFALIAALAWHDKQADDAAFCALLPVIVAGATDERNYVKKAVSWALRHIGKRNAALYAAALATAQELAALNARSARWIARETVKDLNSVAAQRRRHQS
jgi:3-methyladenine DNA glycosylase AlkD